MMGRGCERMCGGGGGGGLEMIEIERQRHQND